MSKLFVATILGFACFSSLEATAASKFIPLGHSNLDETANLPRFGSPQSEFNLQSDIYETRNYIYKKELRESESQLKRFKTAPEYNPANPYIDY